MVLALSTGAAHGQAPAAPTGKAYIDQIPRNLPPRPMPAPPQPAAGPGPAQAAPPITRPAAMPAAAPRSTAASPQAVARPGPPPRNPACRIQAGAFGQRANADKLGTALRPMGAVTISEMTLGGKTAYRVTLVGLGGRKDAEAVLARLKTSGHNLGALAISGC